MCRCPKALGGRRDKRQLNPNPALSRAGDTEAWKILVDSGTPRSSMVGVPEASQMLHQAADLARRAAELLDEGRVDEATLLQRDADLAMKRARRALSSTSAGRGARMAPRTQAPPDREVVVASLAELEVPASPKLVTAYAAARFGSELRPSAFASIRRDEQRAWRSPRAARAVYIVPALDAGRLTPLRGLVTLSDWDLPRRIVGPRSARVDHLRATRAVARHYLWIRDTAAESRSAEGLGQLLADMARTLPGGGDRWETPDPERVIQASDSELALLEEDDSNVRSAAGDRARGQLADDQILWGAAPLAVVEAKHA